MGKRGWILAVILAGLMVVGIGGGVILAHGGVKGVGGFGRGAGDGESLTERVAEILGVEESALEDALTQAKRAMANDAVRARMDAMVEKDLITQEEADEYVEWFESRPEFLDRGGLVERDRMGNGMSKSGWRSGGHWGKRGGNRGAGHENSW